MQWRQTVGCVGFACAFVAAACGKARRDGPGSSGDDAPGTAGDPASAGAAGTTAGVAGTTAGEGGASTSGGGASVGGGQAATGGAAPVQGGTAGGPSARACPLLQSKPPGDGSPAHLRIGGINIGTAERDCQEYVVAASLALPVEAAARLLFQYDVNDDGVDDLFTAPRVPNEEGDAPVTVLASTFSGVDLSFEPLDCELGLPGGGYMYFVRDLNRDGFADLVIGMKNGVRALVHRADGTTSTVLDFTFPDANGWVSVLDVAVGDFDADGEEDLAIGFDRATGEAVDVEMGVLVFPAVARGGASALPSMRRTKLWSAGDADGPTELGYVAAFADGKGLLGLAARGDQQVGGWLYRDARFTDITEASWPAFPNFVGSTVIDGREHALVAAQNIIYGYEVPVAGAARYATPTALEHPLFDHELGGGGRFRSYYLLDLDGDGDDDLVERGVWDATGETALFAIRTGDGSAGLFASPQLLPLSLREPGSETPFVAAGKMRGRLFVSAADPTVADAAPTVNVLACADR